MHTVIRNIAVSARGQFLRLAEFISGTFLTYHARPIYAEGCGNVSTIVNPLPTAIVMQGPILTDHNFTLETIRLYKKIFPETRLILSTWDDTEPSVLLPFRQEPIVLLLNTKPLHAGISNVNLQILSTAVGIRKAQELGAQYVLKTRTDQRIYASNALAYLYNLLQSFPLSQQNIQKRRLVGTSLNTFKYRPYSISDMFLFGDISDMLLYWDVPFDDRPQFPTTDTTMRAYAKAAVCEIYFVTSFLKKLGHTPTFTIADSWSAYGKYFCVIDQQSLDLYWYKYEREKEFRRLRYSGIYSDEELSFREWVLLYAGAYNANSIPESILEQPFRSKIA